MSKRSRNRTRNNFGVSGWTRSCIHFEEERWRHVEKRVSQATPARFSRSSTERIYDATGRQIELHEQTETPGRAHRGRLRTSRYSPEGSQAPRLGHSEQRNWRRQETRVRTRPSRKPRVIAQRGTQGRPRDGEEEIICESGEALKQGGGAPLSISNRGN